MEYIDRNLCETVAEYDQYYKLVVPLEKIRKMPAADVVPVMYETPMLRYRPERYERYDEYGVNENGEMLYVKRVFVDEKSYAMYCPACGKRLCSRFINFCPNCGAKMDGAEKSTD